MPSELSAEVIEAAAEALWSLVASPNERVTWATFKRDDGTDFYHVLARAALNAAEPFEDFRDVADELLHLIESSSRDAFKNGNTDTTGQIDEGEVRAAEIVQRARQALNAAGAAQPDEISTEPESVDRIATAWRAHMLRFPEDAQGSVPGNGFAGDDWRPNRIRGRCPSCGGDSLFVGKGGYLTCARLDCKEPTAADTLINTGRFAPDGVASPSQVTIP